MPHSPLSTPLLYARSMSNTKDCGTSLRWYQNTREDNGSSRNTTDGSRIWRKKLARQRNINPSCAGIATKIYEMSTFVVCTKKSNKRADQHPHQYFVKPDRVRAENVNKAGAVICIWLIVRTV